MQLKSELVNAQGGIIPASSSKSRACRAGPSLVPADAPALPGLTPLPAAVAAQLLDGLASYLPASLLIELQLLGANMHLVQCLRERVAHQFGAGHRKLTAIVYTKITCGMATNTIRLKVPFL